MASPVGVWHTRLIAVATAACLTGTCACVASPSKPSVSSTAGLSAPTDAPGRPSWAPWPAALHDARHRGASVSPGPTAGTLRWRRQLEGAATAGPVIGPDGTIYAASNGGVLHALNPSTGTDLWTYNSGHT